MMDQLLFWVFFVPLLILLSGVYTLGRKAREREEFIASIKKMSFRSAFRLMESIQSNIFDEEFNVLWGRIVLYKTHRDIWLAALNRCTDLYDREPDLDLRFQFGLYVCGTPEARALEKIERDRPRYTRMVG